jgi:thiol-disulfide isomerase/thioredoxin
MTTTTAPNGYRIAHPTMRLVLSDMRISATDPGPGDQVPLLDIELLDGGRLTVDALRDDGRPLLLVFGSLTCPVTESAMPGLQDLHERYGDHIRVVLVTVREAHPGARVGQPDTAEAKHETARTLRAHHGVGFEIGVDDIEGTHHRAFGTRPSSSYLIDPDGTIRFRAHWSNLTGDLDDAIKETIAGRALARPALGGTVRAMAAMTGYADSAFRSAGPGAMADTWRAAPPFGMMIMVSRLFGFLPTRVRGAATMVMLGVAALAVAVVVGALLL